MGLRLDYVKLPCSAKEYGCCFVAFGLSRREGEEGSVMMR